MSTQEKRFGPTALLTPANLMTGFRLVIAPVFIWLLLEHRVSWWTVAVGLAVAASDYFDGIVARRHGTTTSGAFLDPLADKVVVIGGLWACVLSRPQPVTFFIAPAILITLREIWMSVYRSHAARRGLSVPASRLAKWKTFAQDWAIGFTVLPFTADRPVFADVTIWVAVLLTLYTGWQYYADAKKVLARAR